MIERLKKLWDESGTKEFGAKYVLPLVALLLTWFSFGQLYTSSLKLEDLIKTTGTVKETEIFFERGTRTNYEWLTIRLREVESSFRILEHFKSRFKEFQTKISKGDTITIYTRTHMQTAFGPGQSGDIYQIEKRNQVLLDFKWMTNFNKDGGYATVFLCIFFWAIYFGLMIKRIREKKAAANKMHVP